MLARRDGVSGHTFGLPEIAEFRRDYGDETLLDSQTMAAEADDAKHIFSAELKTPE